MLFPAVIAKRAARSSIALARSLSACASIRRLPMPCACCWQGAWYVTVSRSGRKSVRSSTQSCSIMTEPNRCRTSCKSLGCESGVDLGSRRRVGARPGACDRGYQGRCIDDAAERRLVDRRQRVAARAAD